MTHCNLELLYITFFDLEKKSGDVIILQMAFSNKITKVYDSIHKGRV